jgi:hypothetical protein
VSSLWRYAFSWKTADTENIYAYFVDVTFANGTRYEVPAGYTSFKAVLAVEQTEMETFRTIATPPSKCKEGFDCPDSKEEVSSQDQYTLELTFPKGRHVVRGIVPALFFLTLVSLFDRIFK